MSTGKEPNSILLLNAATGKVSSMLANANFEATALKSVATLTPKAGSLEGFGAPKQPTRNTDEFKITVQVKMGEGNDAITMPHEIVVLEKGENKLSDGFTKLLNDINRDTVIYNEEKAEHEAEVKRINNENARLKQQHDNATKTYPRKVQEWQNANRKKMNRPSFDESTKPKPPVEPIYLQLPVFNAALPDLNKNDILKALTETAANFHERDPFEPALAKRCCEAFQVAIFEFIERDISEEANERNKEKLSEVLSAIDTIRAKMNELGLPHEADDLIGMLYDGMIHHLDSGEFDSVVKSLASSMATIEMVPDEVATGFMQSYNQRHQGMPEKHLQNTEDARTKFVEELGFLLSREAIGLFNEPKRLKTHLRALAQATDQVFMRNFLLHLLDTKNESHLLQFGKVITQCITYQTVMTQLDQIYTSMLTGMANSQHWHNLGPAEEKTIDVPTGTYAIITPENGLKLGFTLQDSSMVWAVKHKPSGEVFAFHADTSSDFSMLHSAFVIFAHKFYPGGDIPGENTAGVFDISIIGGAQPMEICAKEYHSYMSSPEKMVIPYKRLTAAKSYAVYSNIIDVCKLNELVITSASVFDERMPRSFYLDANGDGLTAIFGKRASILPHYRQIAVENGLPDSSVDLTAFMNNYLHSTPEHAYITNFSVDGRSAKRPVHNPYIVTPATRQMLDDINPNGGVVSLSKFLSAELPEAPSLLIANIIHEAFIMKREVNRVNQTQLLRNQAEYAFHHLLDNNMLYQAALNPLPVQEAPEPNQPKFLTTKTQPAGLTLSGILGKAKTPFLGKSIHSGSIEDLLPARQVKKEVKPDHTLIELIYGQTQAVVNTAWTALFHTARIALPLVSQGSTDDKPFTDIMEPLTKAIKRGGISVPSGRRGTDGQPIMIHGVLKKSELSAEEKAKYPKLEGGLKPDHEGIAAISQEIMDNASRKWNSLGLHQAIMAGNQKAV